MSNASGADERAAWVTPANLPGLLPSRPVLSSPVEGWGNLVLQRYQHPPGRADVPGLRDHLLVAQLAGPALVEEVGSGGSRERRWFASGQVHVTPAGHRWSRVLKNRADVLLIHIAPELVRMVAEEVYDLDPASVWLIPRFAVPDEALDRIGRLLLVEMAAGAPGSSLMVEVLGRALTLNLLRRHSNLAPLPTERCLPLRGVRLRRVLDQMRTHMDERVSLTQLAEIGGLSPSRFTRAFRDAMGQPPHHYLINLRVEKARELLADTDLSVTEIGLRCGFQQSSHFATMFRKVTGLSPRAWRGVRRW